jgi:hypothetical protein
MHLDLSGQHLDLYSSRLRLARTAAYRSRDITRAPLACTEKSGATWHPRDIYSGDRDWKTLIFFERAVLISLNAC